MAQPKLQASTVALRLLGPALQLGTSGCSNPKGAGRGSQEIN